MKAILYKHRGSILKIKRLFNFIFKLEITKYPTPDLIRRIKLIKYHNIETIIDVGANIGSFAQDMRSIGFKWEIISFEPLNKAFKELSTHASWDRNWHVFNYALWDKDGFDEINVSKNSASSSLLQSLPQLTESAPWAAYFDKQNIQVHKLDTIFGSLDLRNKNIYLKIDVQGYEEQVLKGARESLCLIKGIQIEMPLVPTYDGALDFEGIKERLNKLGFSLMAFENWFYDKKTGRQLEVDGIFYRY